LVFIDPSLAKKVAPDLIPYISLAGTAKAADSELQDVEDQELED
jgi:hypothetical protein